MDFAGGVRWGGGEVEHRRAKRTVAIKWVRMAQVVWRAMLPRRVGGESATRTFPPSPLSSFSNCSSFDFYFIAIRGHFCESCFFFKINFNIIIIFFTHAAGESAAFPAKSHHTPFFMRTASSAFEVCVAMLRCVTYSTPLAEIVRR